MTRTVTMRIVKLMTKAAAVPKRRPKLPKVLPKRPPLSEEIRSITPKPAITKKAEAISAGPITIRLA